MSLEPYWAPRPKFPKKTLAINIISRILFPPILLWDAIKFLINKLAGAKLGNLMLPAQNNHFSTTKEELDKIWMEAQRNKNIDIEELSVVTYDHANLDTFQIKPKANKFLATQEQPFIVNFIGNAMTYREILDEMVEDAQVLSSNVIGFDYRGVMHSSGKPKSANDLVTDGIAQVQRILDSGANPEKIMLKGHSIGAGIATLVAKHFHDLGINVNVFNGRSFSSFTNAAVGHIRTLHTRTGHGETFGWKILGYLAMPIIKLALLLTKWEIDVAAAFKSLPATHKEYYCVRSSKAQRAVHGSHIKDDAVITHYGSLHMALKFQRSQLKRKIDNKIKKLNSNGTHALASAEAMNQVLELREERARLNLRKMECVAPDQDAHSVDPNKLLDRHAIKTATCFFRKYVQHTYHRPQKLQTSR